MQDVQDTPVPVEHIDGLDHIEIISEGRGRFCLYENRRLPGGKFIIIPKRDIIMPLASLPDAIAKCMAVSAAQLAGRLYRLMPLSMH